MRTVKECLCCNDELAVFIIPPGWSKTACEDCIDAGCTREECRRPAARQEPNFAAQLEAGLR
jgi:hypothetical protein